MQSRQSSSGPSIRPGTTSRPTTARPWTAQSTATARPQTAASGRHDGTYIIALVEGRGIAREIGMAALDKDTGRVMLVQLADCQTYVKTLHQMHLHPPSLVLLPDTFLSAAEASSKKQNDISSTMLIQFIQEEFPGIVLEPVLRRYFNDTCGLDFIQQLCVEDDERTGTLLAVANK